MWKKKKAKKQSMESVELNDDQLDAVSGGNVSQNPDTGKWHVVTGDGATGCKEYDSKAEAQAAAMFLYFRSPKVVDWDKR